MTTLNSVQQETFSKRAKEKAPSSFYPVERVHLLQQLARRREKEARNEPVPAVVVR